jgi:hypothetical protein
LWSKWSGVLLRFPHTAFVLMGFIKNLPENQCIFVRGFRVTRFLKILPRLRGAASPTQDPNGPEPEFETQLISIPANTNVKFCPFTAL